MPKTENRERQYKKLFGLFFLIMFALTLLSRVLDSLMLPKVQAAGYTSGNLTYQIEGEGSIRAAQSRYIDVPPGVKVERVLEAGEIVAQGDGIIFLQISDLERQRTEKEREVKKLQLSLEQESIRAKAPAGIGQVRQMAGDLALGEKKMEDAIATWKETQEEYAEEAKKLSEKRDADLRFARQQMALSKENGGGMGTADAEAELVYEKSAAAVEEEYDRSLKQLDAKLEETEAQMTASQEAYSTLLYHAQLAQESDSHTAGSEQANEQISRKAQEILQLDIDAGKEEIKWLETWIASGGEVPSPCAGTIMQMEVSPGTATQGSEIVEVGYGGAVLTAGLAKEETELLEEGDEVEVILPMDTQNRKGSIDTITIRMRTEDARETTMSQRTDSYALFTAGLDEGEYRLGSTAQYRIIKNSNRRYACLIPIGAVREDSSGKYCLIAEKQSTILGEEDIAVRINLEVIRANDGYAAVGSVFTQMDRIITSSNKSVKEGDRVRVQP